MIFQKPNIAKFCFTKRVFSNFFKLLEYLLWGNQLPISCNRLPMIEFDFKKFLTEFVTFQLICKWCNRLQYIGNQLPLYLNVEIQNQLWRVISFHKMHCVIDYMVMLIDYQWQVLNKRSRDVTLPMVFSRFSQGYNSSNGFLDQTWRVYKNKTLTCIRSTSWTTFEKYWNLCFSSFFFFLLSKSFLSFLFSKPCSSASENYAENKSVLYLFILFSLCQKEFNKD